MPTWTKTGNIKGPKGDKGDIGNTGATGSPGSPGAAATATAGTTTTGAPGTSASVVNAGTTSAAVFNFTIPRGDVGATGPASTVPGPAGSAATIAAGTATGLPAGSAPTVNNSGTSSAAVFNFGIPAGQTGATGPASTVPGPPGSTGPAGSAGIPAYTNLSAGFTVPAIGSTVVVSVANSSWMTVGEYIWIAGAGPGGQAGPMQITAIAGNSVTLLNVGSVAGSPPVAHATTHEAGGSDPIPLDLLASPSDNTNLNASFSAHGLLPKLLSGSGLYLGSDGNWTSPTSAPIGFYGSDTTSTTNYAVTVSSYFALTAGVVVYFTITNNSAANPTLNVNGTGAISIRNRANIALLANELAGGPKTHGVVYDGTNWRLITPCNRWYNANNPANPTIECLGFDAVTVCATFTSVTGAGITLAHLTWGVPVTIDILNNTGAAMAYWVLGTNLAGAAYPTYFVFSNTFAGAGALRFDNTAAQSLTTGQRFVAFGGVMEQYLFFK